MVKPEFRGKARLVENGSRACGVKRGGHRAQHISSIAHLFFQQPAPHSPPPSSLLEFAVASPGFSPVAAYAAAGLAAASADHPAAFLKGGHVLLQEGAGRMHGASTYFSGDGLRAEPGSPETRTWRLVSRLPSGEPQGDRDIDRLVWRHLGPVGADALARLSLLVSERTLAATSTGGGDGLVWCVLEHEAGSFTASLRLGALAELVNPRRIEILLFRDFPAGPVGGGVLPARAGTGSGRTCFELARKACPAIPMEVTSIELASAGRPVSSQEVRERFKPVLDRLVRPAARVVEAGG